MGAGTKRFVPPTARCRSVAPDQGRHKVGSPPDVRVGRIDHSANCCSDWIPRKLGMTVKRVGRNGPTQVGRWRGGPDWRQASLNQVASCAWFLRSNGHINAGNSKTGSPWRRPLPTIETLNRAMGIALLCPRGRETGGHAGSGQPHGRCMRQATPAGSTQRNGRGPPHPR
jgi:hypothetical protein